MKTAGVIPSLYNSSRFQGKPLADLCGKPMFWWVYQQALKTGLDEVILATDDERIFQKAELNAQRCLLIRPKILSM